MRFSARSPTAEARLALGSMVTTSRPLQSRIMLTVIVASLDFTALLPAEGGGDSEGNVFRGKRHSVGMVARVQCIMTK
jgi:hypothetical protein